MRRRAGALLELPVPRPDHLPILEEIWSYLADTGRWPSFIELDRALSQNHDIEAMDVLPTVAPGLITGVAGHWPPLDSQVIALTLAGAHATGKARREVELFLLCVRRAADHERHFVPSPDDHEEKARLTPASLTETQPLPASERCPLLIRLGALLSVEQWGWTQSDNIGSPDWTFDIDRNVRPFRAVTDAGSYWRARQQQSRGNLLRTGTTTSGTQSGSTNSLTQGEILAISLSILSTIFAGLSLQWQPLRTVSLVTFAICAALAYAQVRIGNHAGKIRFALLAIIGAAAILLFAYLSTSAT